MSWNDSSVNPPNFMTKVNYSCDKARKFVKHETNPDTGEDEEVFYDLQVYECQWNKTWSPYKPVSFLNSSKKPTGIIKVRLHMILMCRLTSVFGFNVLILLCLMAWASH